MQNYASVMIYAFFFSGESVYSFHQILMKALSMQSCFSLVCVWITSPWPYHCSKYVFSQAHWKAQFQTRLLDNNGETQKVGRKWLQKLMFRWSTESFIPLDSPQQKGRVAACLPHATYLNAALGAHCSLVPIHKQWLMCVLICSDDEKNNSLIHFTSYSGWLWPTS